MQASIVLCINFPLIQARSPSAASWCVQQQFPRLSVCLSAAGLGCVLPPSPSLPPVSSQTKVGDAGFFSALKGSW